MYMAELRGKLSEKSERREDILTSNVFSLFKYADRKVFLRSFLCHLGINISNTDAENAEFQFWPRYPDNTEPDLVIVAGPYYLLVEAKYYSSFEWKTEEKQSQLYREIRGGLADAKNFSKKFFLLAITADYVYRPGNFVPIVGELPTGNFKWVNWQQIEAFLLNVLQNEAIAPPTRLFCEDLCQLLERKNLRPFQSFGSVLSGTGADILQPLEQIFLVSETTAFRDDFLGFMSTLSLLEDLGSLPDRVFWVRRSLFADLESIGSEFEVQNSEIFYREAS